MANYHRTPTRGRRGGGGFGGSMVQQTPPKYPSHFTAGGYAMVKGAKSIELYPFTTPYVDTIQNGNITLKQGIHKPVTIEIKEKDDGKQYAELTQSGCEKNKTFEVVPYNPDGA